MEKYSWNPGILRHTQDHPGIPSPIQSYGKYPWNPGIFRHTQDHPRIPPSIESHGKVSLDPTTAVINKKTNPLATRDNMIQLLVKKYVGLYHNFLYALYKRTAQFPIHRACILSMV